MSVTHPAAMEYSAGIRILTSTDRLTEISSLLDMKPHSILVPVEDWEGDKYVWQYYEDDEAETSESGKLFNEIFDRLRLSLTGKEDIIRTLADQEEAVFWCAGFSDDPEHSFELSPQNLQWMATTGARLYISSYYCEEEDEKEEA